MDDRTINIKLDEIKKGMSLIQISENNLDSALKTKVNSSSPVSQADFSSLQTTVTNLQNQKVNIAQGSSKANKNIVTDSNGNITTEEKPTMPIVNDATLTIKKNGTNVASFSANSSTNTTANIEVPTQASDIGAVANTTEINGKQLNANVTLTEDDILDGDSYVRTENNFTTTYKNTIDANATNRHTHSNKSLLDSYDQTNANLSDAVSKKHNHTNSTVLNNTTASYTTEEKTKLSGIASGAQVNTVYSVNGRTGNVIIPASDFELLVPTSRKINNKALSYDINLTCSDVGALPSNTQLASTLSVSNNKVCLKDGFNTTMGSEIDLVQGVNLNGSTTKTPSFYAPTGAGTSGQLLVSNGSGAPVWQTIQNGTEIVDNLSSTSTTSALSANQGNILQTLITSLQNNKASSDASNINEYAYQLKLNNLQAQPLTDSAAHTYSGQASVLESYLSSDKKVWYRGWSDGWKECGFICDYTSWGQHTIQLPLPGGFSNTNYLAVCGLAGNHSSSFGVLYSGIISKTKTSLSTYFNNSTSSGSNGSIFKNIYCCGY